MSIRRSLAFSFLEKYASTAINIVSTLVLARLLTPEEIGVFSVGAAVVGIMHTLRDFGVTNYLIQEREVDREKIRTAFTVTLALSLVFAAALWLGRDWAAAFYREEGVRQIVGVMAVNFLFIPFGSPILALMRRDMQFGRLAGIQLTSTAINAVVSIVLAALGYGFMSLAWASLAGVATTCGLAFACRPGAFVPIPGIREWRSVLAFGGYASTSALIADLRVTAPDLILGRMLSFEAVGLYSRALGLLSIFNRLIMEGLYPVLLPALSEKTRQGEDLKPYYLRGLSFITSIYWPFLLFLSFMADPIILLLLGDQWIEAAPLVWPICCAMGMGFLSFMHQPILISIGQIRQVLVINIVISTLVVASVLVGSQHSLQAVALLSIPSSAISSVFIFIVLRKFIAVSLWEIVRSIIKSSVIFSLTLLSLLASRTLDLDQKLSPMLAIIVLGIPFGLSWLAGVFGTNHPLKLELMSIFTRGKQHLGWERPV